MTRSTVKLMSARRLSRGLLACLLSTPLLVAAGAAGAFDADNDSVSDEADAFPCQAGASSVVFAPAQGQHGMLLVEDQWPQKGDLDFNDAVIAYNYAFETNSAGQVLSLRATYNLLAVGGLFDNGLALHVPAATGSAASVRLTVGNGPSTALSPVSSEPELTVQLLANMRSVYGNLAGTINSDPSKALQSSGLPVEVEVTFSAPVQLDTSQAPFDLYIFRSAGPNHEIHRPQFAGTGAMNQGLFHSADDGSTLFRHFVDTDGLPFIIDLPGLYAWSQEGVSIEHLYPNIVQFAASGGTQARDFYANGVDLAYAYGATANTGIIDADHGPYRWSSPVSPRFIGPADIPADTGCVSAWGLSVVYGTARDTFGYDSVMDGSGNLIVTGYTSRGFTGNVNQGGQDVFVAKYSRSGGLLWSRQFGGSGNDAGRSVAVDSAGNIYVVGETRSASFGGVTGAGQSDAFLTKLDSAGSVQWSRLLGGSGYDYATGVAVSTAGDIIYVGGGSTSNNLPGATYPGNGPFAFLTRFDGTGTRQWVRQYRTDSAHQSNYSYISDIALDGSGNVLAVGSERRYNLNSSASENQFVVKHASDGTTQWTSHLGDYGYYQGTADYRLGHAFAVSADASGAVYVVGTWEAGSTVSRWGSWNRTSLDRSSDVTVTKLSAAGAVQWSQSLGSVDGQSDMAQAVRTDASGNVYVTGYTAGRLSGQTSQGGYDYLVARFDPSGVLQWQNQGGTSSNDGGFALGLDSTQGIGFTVGNTGSVSGVPTAFQNTYYGFLTRFNLTSGTRDLFQPTVDTSGLSTSCQTIKVATASAPDGLYTIDPDGAGSTAPFDAYCDMTTDTGGWTLVARMDNGSTAVHRNREAVGVLTSPSQSTTAKLSDVVINQLRGASYIDSVFRTTAASGTKDFFRDARAFDALGAGNSINTVYDTYATALSRTGACIGTQNPGYHTGLVGWDCYDYFIYADNPGFRAWTYQGGAVWVKALQ